MLRFLCIRDFVIVDFLELDFSPGFTVLTGETGAGKSILIDALSLVLGERGDAGMVRSGCGCAEISAEFDIAGLPDLQARLCEQELGGDGSTCLFRRILDASGRSRGFINGRSVTLQQMREMGSYLLDIQGQHAHQSLLRPNMQRALLDAYAGLENEVGILAGLFREWQALRYRQVELKSRSEGTVAERDLLSFQKRELETLNFSLPAWEELQEEYARLSHAASLMEIAHSGMELLGDAETACLNQLNAFAVRLRDSVQFDGALQNILDMVESGRNNVQEAVYALRHYLHKLDIDPQRLREQEQRIAAVMDVARKYRVAPEQLPAVLQDILTRLDAVISDDDLDALAQQETIARDQYQFAANEISSARKKAAEKLSAAITDLMQSLAMQGGRLIVALKPLMEGNAHGLETTEFQIAINAGSPLSSLAKVASGGELARISLAIQVATSQAATVPTLIFDEVDSGIGGKVAEIVGALLKRLGRRHQVICVTHLPQVAAMADTQWQVSKAIRSGITVSSISILSPEERIEEIARMLGGVIITGTTRKHAAEMLEAGLSLPS
uniref:DNA repair protein RecN n=1 Tax=Candidatus Nitrotoga fabula TaxID=2182327 RepID=A0A2X0SHH5_9PROT|nr:recombination and repair protein [Candidatus Nitrotoga fabula]